MTYEVGVIAANRLLGATVAASNNGDRRAIQADGNVNWNNEAKKSTGHSAEYITEIRIPRLSVIGELVVSLRTQDV
jgi:hypothetical protein